MIRERDEKGERKDKRVAETRGKESAGANGDGDSNAVNITVDGRWASLRAFRYHFLTVLLGEHVPGV